MNNITNNHTNNYLVEKPTDIKIFPVSPAQKRLWFHDLTNIDGEAYNLHRVFRIKGAVRKDILEHSINILFDNQKSFHTIFREKEGKLFQVILPPRKIELPVINLKHLSIADVEDKSNTLIKEIIGTPFNISKWPLFRVHLLEFENHEYLFCFAMHHIISDWWSMGLLYSQLSEIYNTLTGSNNYEYRKLKMQYSDFSFLRDQELKQGMYDKQLSYWKNKLAYPSELNFPYDYARLETSKNTGNLISVEIPAGITESIKKICRTKEVSLYVFLLTAFGILLQRLSGNRDINIGLPIANRNNADFENIIGFFINIIVARINFSEEVTFNECLHHVREDMYKAYDNQDVPFDKVVEALNPSRNINKNPLFQFFFNMLGANDKSFALNNVEVQRINYDIDIKSYFDFTIYITDKTETLLLTSLFDTSLFKRNTIEKMLQQYRHLLSQIVTGPSRIISEYSLKLTGNNECLPDPGKNIDPTFGNKSLIDSIFENNDASVVLSANNETFSLKEVNDLCNMLGSYLMDCGVKQDDNIIVYADRNAVLILTIISIIKIDGVFSIVDLADQPVNQVTEQLLITNPKAGIFITGKDESLSDKWNELKNKTTISIELPGDKTGIYGVLKKYKDVVIQNLKQPDNDCYICYTSGSTGKPKAILGSMRPVSSFINNHVNSFGLKATYRYAMLSGLTHDPLLRDIFVPLCQGAALFVPDNDLIKSLKLANWLNTFEINVINITPSLGRILVYNIEEQVESVKYIFCGGDRLDGKLVDKLKRKFPNSRIINCYGTTETPQIMSYFEVPDSYYSNFLNGKIEKIYIGSQTETSQLLIVRNNKLSGVGEIGEIWVRTPYLSKGYYNDTTGTGNNYMLNPFTNNSNDRIYKTGDSGRYNPDGNIEFIGRKDNQVKIRGQRIELNEIEATLDQYPSVENCAVVVIDGENDEKSLHAFYVSDQNISSLNIKSFLRKTLPDYMIPSGISKIDSIPLNKNNKTDYEYLKNVKREKELIHSKVPPKTSVEKQIGNIWMQTLNLNDISLTDNFFDIGGHSLKALEVVAAIRNKFNIDIVFRDFINNNLGQFCKLCEDKLRTI